MNSSSTCSNLPAGLSEEDALGALGLSLTRGTGDAGNGHSAGALAGRKSIDTFEYKFYSTGAFKTSV